MTVGGMDNWIYLGVCSNNAGCDKSVEEVAMTLFEVCKSIIVISGTVLVVVFVSAIASAIIIAAINVWRRNKND